VNDGQLLTPLAGPTALSTCVRYGKPTSRVPSFTKLYATYFSFVWSSARHLGVEADELDDVVQDIFVKVYERLHTLEQPESLRSWIYGIVRRVVSMHRRSKRFALVRTGAVHSELQMRYSEMTTPHQLVEGSEDVKLFWSLLDKIDAPKRETFVLAELQYMTAPEIAAATHVPRGTVYSRLRAARHELETALQKISVRTLTSSQTCPNLARHSKNSLGRPSEPAC
jgi:RNA polymerase sigma-70 factor, ECF subfamily